MKKATKNICFSEGEYLSLLIKIFSVGCYVWNALSTGLSINTHQCITSCSNPNHITFMPLKRQCISNSQLKIFHQDAIQTSYSGTWWECDWAHFWLDETSYQIILIAALLDQFFLQHILTVKSHLLSWLREDSSPKLKACIQDV